jgi:hypothetical protein
MMKAITGFFLVLALSTVPALSQEFRATISGHVVDSSGGAVPNAKIQAVNLDTNETATATTDASGSYTVPLLRPGNYKVTALATGFKQYVRDGVILEAAKLVGIEIVLEVGSVNESVEVTAEAIVLETQTASRSGVVTTQQVAEMPLNARNPFMLGTMMPGVTFRGAAIWQRPFDNGAIAQWSVNGSRDSSTEFMLDGASNNGQMGGNNIAYVPIVDAVQEFTMQMNQYSAEYGHTGGGIMNVVLKSGTNEFHATGWEYMRRTPLDANTFQNNAIVASASNPKGGAARPNHYLDQYGFQVAGPVYIPKLLEKNSSIRLFYLGSFENYREGTPNPLIVSWPTSEMRNGDFSKVTNSANAAVTIYNPYNYTLDSSGNPARVPFEGNVIPSSMIHSMAKKVTGYMPSPNQATVAGYRYGTMNTSFPGYFDADKFYNLVLKFDWNFGDKHRVFVRHASNDRTEDRAVNGIDNGPGTDGQQPFQRINDAYVMDWVGTVTPTLVLNARASFNRFIEKGYGKANEGFDLGQWGLPASLLSQIPGKAYFGRFNFYSGISGTSGVYNSLGRGQSNNFTNTYQLSFAATKVWGKHTTKAGLDSRQINYLLQNTDDVLQFRSYAGYTEKSWNQADSTSGDPYATFLLGIPEGYSYYALFPWWRNNYYAFYVQDDWKVSRRLTVNLGLRNDINMPAHEKWNRMNGPFNPSAKSSLTSQFSASTLAAYPQLANLAGSFSFAGVDNVGSTPAQTNKNNWQPRIGAAYEVNSRLVVRGGIGLTFSNPNNDYYQSAGFFNQSYMVTASDSPALMQPGRVPYQNVLSNPFPDGIAKPTGSSAGSLTFAGKNNGWFDSGFKTPHVWMFSFGFQYQTSKSSTFEATYVGSRSSNLNMQKDYNLPSLSFRKQCNLLEGGDPNYCDANVTNPFKGIAAFKGTPFYLNDSVSRFQMNRPFPQFSGNLTQYGRNDSNIWYNAVQFTYNLRVRGGLNLMTNYNFSKQTEKWGFNDPYNNVYQQGIYLNDRPHVFKFTTIYELPFGRNKHWGSGANAFAQKLISGWQATTFYTNQSGEPANLPSNVIQLKDPRMAGGGWDGNTDWKAYQPRAWNPCVLRQFNNGTVSPTSDSLARGCGSNTSNYPWLMTASYAPQAVPYRSGQIRRHHAFFMDASISKMTTITERLKMQFGAEAFNLMNHNYYGRDQFNTDPTSSSFGTITPSTVSTQNMLPRQIQLRMKLIW